MSSSQDIIKKTNLLKDKYPKMMLQFDHDLNPGIDPDKLSCGSGKRINWKCDKDPCGCHIWNTKVQSRVRYNYGCPFCAGNRNCMHNSFMHVPKLFDEFDYDLNPGINPYLLSLHSSTRITWICSNDNCGCHIWKVSVKTRLENIDNCPFCAKRRTCVHTNLKSMTKLFSEFDQALNPDVNPHKVSLKSKVKIRWTCNKGCGCHTWDENLQNRIKNNTECPFCTDRMGCKHTTFMNDELLCKEFDQELNPKVDPYRLSINAKTQLLWKCSKNPSGCHIWKSQVSNRRNCIHCK